MTTHDSNKDPLPSLDTMIDRISDQFEAAWRDNREPRIEDYLAEWQGEDRANLMGELLQVELQLRQASGNHPTTEEYVQRFPEHADAVRRVFGDGESATLPLRGHNEEAVVGDKVHYFGDYELIEEIARGGMGVVFKARQTSLNRIVALKMILAGQLAGEEDVKRFHAEAEAAAQLDHPGIVPVYEVGMNQDQNYFSMGLVEGESLAEKIKDGPLQPREAAEFAMKVAEAMAFAHEQGVIHRDLKPANILLDKNGQPKVTDFGLAKKTEGDSGLTGTGQILGTPAFMPPEQASGRIEEIGPLADVYSLGATLYCLLTGRPPFQAANPMDTLLQVLDQDPVAPRVLNRQVPQDLETICLKCLSKDPPHRYESARQLAEDICSYLEGRPILAKPIGRFERLMKYSQRHPAVAGPICAIICLVSLLLYPLTTLDRDVLEAYGAAVSKSAVWLFIIAIYLGLDLVIHFLYRGLALVYSRPASWRESAIAFSWRFVLSLTLLLPAFCIVMLAIQLGLIFWER